MADSKITEMAEITSYDENVITPVVVSDGGNFVNKMIRLKNIKGRDYIAGNGINIINDVISTNDAEINKQDPLVSGVNIKTINGMTLLGSGNITVEGGGTGGEVYVAGYGINITEGNAINVDTNELNNIYQAKMGADDNYVTDSEKTKLSNLSGVNTGDQDLSGLLPKTDASLIYQTKMGADDNYVTDAEKIKLLNLSGTNSGDETASTIKTKLGITTLSGANTGDETTSSIKTKLGITTLSGVNTGDQDLTPYLTIVNASTTYQPLMGSDDNYVTDAEKVKLSNLSGVNTGDQDLSGLLSKTDADLIYQSKMGIDDNYVTDDEKVKLSNLSGVNTGDQDLTPYLTKVEASDNYQVKMGSDDNYVTDDEKVKLSNLSGVNTGDQDLSALATYNYVDATFAPKTRTISAGAGLTGGGSLSGNITLSHADTSSASSITVTNTGTNVLQNLTVSLDTYGHVTNASSSSVDLGSIFALKSEAGGSASVWVPLEGITRLGSTTLSSTIDYTNIIGEQTLVRWQESGTYKIAMVNGLSSSLIYIVGESMTSLDANTFEYCLLPVHEQKFVVAGSLNSVNTNIANIWMPSCNYRVFGCFAYVGTVGTTNNTTIDINDDGTSMFTTKPSIASGSQYTSTIATSNSGLIIGKNSIVTIDLDAVQTTPANDLYVSLYVCPTRYMYLP